MKKVIWILTVASVLNLTGACHFMANIEAQSLSMAKDFYSHNLDERAIEEFIIVFNSSNASAETKSEALFYMGQIAFDQGNYSVALDDWQKLLKDFPTSARAVEIKDRLSQFKDVFSKTIDEKITSAVARTYINNGDFWSKSDMRFTIDGSWMPEVEMAIEWYDRVIKEFPGTEAAELAYRKKLFTILGWKESGQYPQSFGIRGQFKKYIQPLLETFTSFEASFPESPYLQGFRYQIAQSYWVAKDWTNTRVWLNKVIEKGGDQPSFYTETAKARLNKIEY
jgi:tetratricopeptide (TPR) repeat protein